MRDGNRDVYNGGELDRNAPTLTASSPRLIAVVCGDEVLLLDPEKLTVTRAPKSQFTFNADRTSATIPALATEPAGKLVKTDDATLLAHLEDRTLLVTAHQSKAGPMTMEELYETAPVWRSIADVYEPDAALVERLRAIDAPVTLQVVMATWCGDSRQHVPRLLKSVALANNANIRVEIMGIGPEFTTPMDVIVGENITNVPTVIVRREGRELGRFVETPASATVEEDVASIVAGRPKAHAGRYGRGALLTSGTYQLRDAKRRHEGTERFELYARPGGGVIAHSLIGKRNGTSVETWAAIDGDQKPRFVEVTHRGKSTANAPLALPARASAAAMRHGPRIPAARTEGSSIREWPRRRLSSLRPPSRTPGRATPPAPTSSRRRAWERPERFARSWMRRRFRAG